MTATHDLDTQWGVSPEAARLHADALVWDNHGCLPMDPARNAEYLPQLARYRHAGVDVASINIGYGEIPWERHVALASAMRRWLEERAEDYVVAGGVEDIRRARAEQRLAVFFDVEGSAVLERRLERVSELHALGVRWLALAYNLDNDAAGGCHDADRGLTAFGRELIEEMTRVGVIACVSHTGYRSAHEVCERSTRPVILSHSNPRALRDHPRNVPDSLIRDVAATGGTIGVNGIGIFLGENDTRTETMARHVDYLAELVGAEHVSLGLDYIFDAGELELDVDALPATFPKGWGYESGIRVAEIEQLPELTGWMLAHGYPEAAVRGILGENLLRVAGQVWR